jgi:UDP-glucose 4-epimerase
MSAFPIPPRSVCITGGAGFIGSHLVEAFLGTGARVTVIDDLSTGRVENLPQEAELLRADIRSPAALERVREGGFELLVHQAGQIDVRSSVADPVADAEVNVVGSLGLLEAARQGGVARVLFASTGGAIYGEQERFPADEEHPARPLSPYGVAKLAVERYLFYYAAVHGLESIALRYANVYGERQNPHGEAGVVAIFLDRLLEGGTPTINGDGLQTRDYVHVSDVVRANLAAATAPLGGGTPFRVYNVGTGREATVVEVFQLLAEALGHPGEAAHGPAKPGEQRRSAVDPRRLLADLTLPPPLPLEEGLLRTATWFRSRHLARLESAEVLATGSTGSAMQQAGREGAGRGQGIAGEPRK